MVLRGRSGGVRTVEESTPKEEWERRREERGGGEGEREDGTLKYTRTRSYISVHMSLHEGKAPPNTLHIHHSHYALFTQGNMIGKDTGLIPKMHSPYSDR